MQLRLCSYLGKTLVLSLIICLLAGPVASSLSFASTTSSKSEKAQSLGVLNFIKGSGGNYNLEGQLKRSEALVLIAALKGDQNKVEEAKSKVSTLKYTDVKATDWYASYVVYGIENQIASGTSKDKFSPNDPVTHRMFLKMLLSALAFESDKDFTWLSVDEFSTQLGLLNLNAKDNYFDQKLSRGDAFEYLYNALLMVSKGGNEVQIEKLVNANKVTQAELDLTLLGKDFANSPYAATPKKNATSIPVSITVNPISNGQLEVKYAQPMNPTSVKNTNNYKITLVNAPEVMIAVESISYHPETQTAVLKVNADGFDTVFNLTAQNLLTAERDYATIPEINRYVGSPSIKLIVPNGNRITVQTNGLSTKQINKDMLSLKPISSADGTPVIKQIIDQTDSQLTLITSGMKSGSMYQLSFTELYDDKLQLIRSNFSTFVKAGNTEPPKIVSVLFAYDGTSTIVFDKTMDDGTVTDLSNLNLVSQYGKTIKVKGVTKVNSRNYKIDHGLLGANIRYFLELRNQRDEDGVDIGTINATITGTEFTYLKVENYQFTSPTEFTFQISEPVTSETITNASNYKIYDLENRIYTPTKIVYQEGSTEVKLIFATPVQSAFKVIMTIENLRSSNDFEVSKVSIYADTVK